MTRPSTKEEPLSTDRSKNYQNYNQEKTKGQKANTKTEEAESLNINTRLPFWRVESDEELFSMFKAAEIQFAQEEKPWYTIL